MQHQLKNKHPFLQIIAFLGIALTSLVIFSFLSLLAVYLVYGVSLVNDPGIIYDLENHKGLATLKLIQLFNAVGLFIVPPLIFLWMVKDDGGIFSIKRTPAIYFLLVVLLMICALPLINLMAELNEKLQLPQGLSGMEAWMKEKEETSKKVIEAFLKVTTISGLAYNLLLMAIIPGVGEELLFRGVLQRLFHKWFKNHHIAILITAILFSALHMQFYGFLPRMVLGILLGYLLVWSGSIVIPMLAHFTNNAMAVIMYYLINIGKIPKEIEEVGTREDALYFNIASLVMVSILLFFLYRRRVNTLSPSGPA